MISNFAIQMSPCYKKDKFHPRRVALFACIVLVYFGLIFFMRFNIATEIEIDIYRQIYWALAYIVIGFFFYVTHTPERFLTRCFGKKKNSRYLRQTIQLYCPSHGLWHLAVFGNGYGMFWAIYTFNKHVEL